jgi:nitrate/TMAO reductase-like tetraheme cytochrome c subunit
MCSNCYSKWLLARDPAFKERQRQNTRDWVAKNQDKYRAGRKAWKAKQDKQYIRDKVRFRRFGITPEQYKAMLDAQGGTCAICHRPPKAGRALAVDHNHDTVQESDEIRGLLCFRCNFGLSFFSEDANILDRAAEHVRNGAARAKQVMAQVPEAPAAIADVQSVEQGR